MSNAMICYQVGVKPNTARDPVGPSKQRPRTKYRLSQVCDMYGYKLTINDFLTHIQVSQSRVSVIMQQYDDV